MRGVRGMRGIRALGGFFPLVWPDTIEQPFIELQACPLLGSLEDGCELSVSELMLDEVWHRLHEDILERILLFLPARSVCRLRLVCKRWRCLLSSGKFFQFKAAVAPLPPLICSLEHVRLRQKEGPPRHCVPATPPKCHRWRLSFITKDFLDSVPPEDVLSNQWCWSLDEKVDSLDGLICISRGGGRAGLRRMIVVNPATRTFRLLPSVPSCYYGRQLRSARVALDEPFGLTFTLTWHMQSSLGNWVVGIYSSKKSSWTIYEGQMDASNGIDSEVCNNLLYRLVKSGPNSYNCVLYSFDAGRFMKKGVVETPKVVVPSLSHGEYCETDWNLLEHCGDMYLIAKILLSPGPRMHGLEIWKFDLGSLKFQKVGCNSREIMEELFPPPGEHPVTLRAPLRAMSSVGDFICLVISTDSSAEGAVLGDVELKHVVAFNVPRQSWHLLYEESDKNDRLLPLGDGQVYDDRTYLPTYPFMVPNFHIFL